MIVNFEDIKMVMKKGLDKIVVIANKELSGEVAGRFLINYRMHLCSKYPNDPENRLVRGVDDVNEHGVYSLEAETNSLKKVMSDKEKKGKVFFTESNAEGVKAFVNMASLFDTAETDFVSFINWAQTENGLKNFAEMTENDELTLDDMKEMLLTLNKGKIIFGKLIDKIA